MLIPVSVTLNWRTLPLRTRLRAALLVVLGRRIIVGAMAEPLA